MRLSKITVFPNGCTKVSICLPCLNAQPFLEERLQSILAQTRTDWELIVADSYSDDGSWEVLQQHAGDPRVQLHRVPREGPYAGWNACLSRARGEYVHIATADDTAEPTFLEECLKRLDQCSDVDIAVSQFRRIDERGRAIETPQARADRLYKPWLNRTHRRSRESEILVHCCLGIPWTTASALVFRRSLLSRTGLFRTDCGGDADRYWSLKASVHSDTISLPGALATWRRRPGQVSAAHDAAWPRRNLEMMKQTIDQCASFLPGAWKERPGWRERLLWKARQDYRQSFRLDRAVLSRKPHRFLFGATRALVHEPGYLLRRLRSGLAWDAPERRDEYAYLCDLLTDWNVSPEPELLDRSAA